MFIAINHLKAKAGRGAELEDAFAKRGNLDGQPGFLNFELLRQTWGPSEDEVEDYLVMTRWASKDDFIAWTNSDAFRESHAGDRPDYLAGGGHPGGYEVRYEKTGTGA